MRSLIPETGSSGRRAFTLMLSFASITTALSVTSIVIDHIAPILAAETWTPTPAHTLTRQADCQSPPLTGEVTRVCYFCTILANCCQGQEKVMVWTLVIVG